MHTKVDEIEESPAKHRKGNLFLNIQLVLLNLFELLHLSEKDDKFNVIEHQIQYLVNSELIFTNDILAAIFYEVVEAHVTDLCREERVKGVWPFEGNCSI